MEENVKPASEKKTEPIQEEKRQQIEKQMEELYRNCKDIDGKDVNSITYIKQLTISIRTSPITYGIQDALAVNLNITPQNGRGRIEIYQEGKAIAIIDENSNINFSQDYLISMKQISISIYGVLERINGQHFELPDIQEEQQNEPQITKGEVGNFELQAEELETRNMGKKQEQEENNQEPKSEEDGQEPRSEEENMEKIAKKSGLTKDDIKSCSTINPKEKITDSKSFENIANVTGKYTKVFVVSSNGNSKDTSKFGFWGLTPDGQVEQIEGLEERDGVNTGKSIYAINRDGSEVKEQQTSALFTLPNQKEGFSVTIGQYGVVEATYIRRSPTENKFIGSNINSTAQKPTTEEVKDFMDGRKTVGSELQTVIDKTEHQLDETNKTRLSLIDNKENNDKAIDDDQEITLHDGTITTLSQEAQRLGVSPEEYRKEFELAQGDCMTEKIESIRVKFAPQDPDTDDMHEDRGERLTPEEEAWRRRGEY